MTPLPPAYGPPGAYGLGGGGARRLFNATAGGTPGRVVPQVYLAQQVVGAEIEPVQFLNTSAAFSQSDQTRVGALARILERLAVGVSITGQIPAGQTPNSLENYLIQNSVLTPYIGDSPQEDIPAAALIDTRFLDRTFGFRAILDPGNFPSLSFRWRSYKTQLPPADLAETYTAALTLQALFSAPLWNQNV